VVGNRGAFRNAGVLAIRGAGRIFPLRFEKWKGASVTIDFSFERWRRVKDTYGRWWNGELERPLIPVVVRGREPGRPEPAIGHKQWTAAYDFAVSPEEIVDCWDYELARLEFLGDAFPVVWPNFGPGVVAAFLGARTQVAEGTVWFHPPEEDLEISNLHFRLNAEHPWLKRIRAIMQAGIDRWGGLVQIGTTDLGGNLDILSTFRPGEKLLLDLYDHPDEVRRLTWEAHEVWWRCFDLFNAVLQPTNPGYSAWAGIYSSAPHYMLQCDFCYMIGPAMFDEFVKPELAATCGRLDNPFYHLDGVGQLNHLDSLLGIANLKGVQWVPGTGQPDCGAWPEVYEKIQRAGKRIQFLGSLDQLDRVVDRIGSAKGFVLGCRSVGPTERDKVLRHLERYGVA